MGQFCPGKGGFDNLEGHVQHERQAYMPVGSWTQDVGIIVERTFLQFPTEKEGSTGQVFESVFLDALSHNRLLFHSMDHALEGRWRKQCGNTAPL